MADQIEVAKLTAQVLIGPVADSASVSKLVMYVWATPGESGPDTSGRQGHVNTQIIVRG